MFNINLMTFSKRLNSTKIPSNVFYDTFSCVFLDSQSIMNPVVVIEDTKLAPADMLEYNYAYIQELKRYYFISNTVILSTGRYCYYLQVDVLTSFKPSILNSTQYVMRSTNHYNEYIIDKMYPTLPLSSDYYDVEVQRNNTVRTYNNKTASWVDSYFFHQSYTDGSVIFGVTGQGNVSISYYVCTVAEFKSFINRVVTATPTGLNWGNLPDGVKTTMSNLMQYITFAKWIPFFPLTDNLGTSIVSVNLGTTPIDVNAYKVTPGLHHQLMYFSILLPNHPLINEHLYYNMSPYREASLFFMPLGIVPIDTSKVYGTAEYITVCFDVDLASGDTLFYVSNTPPVDEYSFDQILYSSTGDIGVNLSLTDYSLSVEAALISASSFKIGEYLSSFGANDSSYSYAKPQRESNSIGAQLLEQRQQLQKRVENSIHMVGKNALEPIGNTMGALGNALTSVADFISSSLGQITMTGTTGSFLSNMFSPSVFCWFKKHGEEDYDRFGRPFFESIQLSNILGFCVCKDASIQTFSGTIPLKTELQGIIDCMNTGFYLE